MDYLFPYSASLDHLLENREEPGVVCVHVCAVTNSISVSFIQRNPFYFIYSVPHVNFIVFKV